MFSCHKIVGLKCNLFPPPVSVSVSTIRIDAETCSLKEKLGEMKALQNPSSEDHEESSAKQTAAMIEVKANIIIHAY